MLPTPSLFDYRSRRSPSTQRCCGKGRRKTAEKVLIDECMRPGQSGMIQTNIQAPHGVDISELRERRSKQIIQVVSVVNPAL